MCAEVSNDGTRRRARFLTPAQAGTVKSGFTIGPLLAHTNMFTAENAPLLASPSRNIEKSGRENGLTVVSRGNFSARNLNDHAG